mmetsp:Transcript_14900/g.24363  ORF Transcript_14900/g.24363 Transcript_14900/m.24363 type:complete len:220 (-) Transcript_14900:116-775(-)
MNLFRLCGDMLHVSSIMILLHKLHKNKSCIGISCRTQEVYLVVFICRYLDLFWNFISLYNSVMKSAFIISTGYLIYLMRHKPGPVKATYNRDEHDKFNYELYLLPPCCVLGLMTAHEWTVPEYLWTVSIWLESVAILPQILLLQEMREVENLTSHFVYTMGLYRFFYILNWIYRYFDDSHVNYVGWLGGIVQTALYADFFYYYMKSKSEGSKLVLPGHV